MKRLAVLIVLLLAALSAAFYLRSLAKTIKEPREQSSQNKEAIPEMPKEPISFPLLATPELLLQPNSAAIYCATIQLAWNEMGDKHLGFPIQLSGQSEIEDSLNRRLFSSGDIGPDGVLVHSGPCTQEAVDKLQDRIDETFPGSQFPLPSLRPDSWFAFSCLVKNLEFKNPFDRLNALSFNDLNGDRLALVESFGIEKSGSRNASLREQIRVLHESSDKSFILELKTKSEGDELLLAKIPAKATLQETIDSALEMISSSEPSSLDYEDELIIPVIQINAMYSFPEMVGKVIENPGFEGQFISEFTQWVRFQLDETGARLESSALIVEANGHRVYRFDNPFLLMIKKKGSPRPYFAMWIGDARFLVTRKW